MFVPTDLRLSKERAIAINAEALAIQDEPLRFLTRDGKDLHLLTRFRHRDPVYHSGFLTLSCSWFWVEHWRGLSGEFPLTVEIVFTETSSGRTVTDLALERLLMAEFKPLYQDTMNRLGLVEIPFPSERPQQLSLF